MNAPSLSAQLPKGDWEIGLITKGDFVTKVTDEAIIYLPGGGEIRIEDTEAADAIASLTAAAPELLSVVAEYLVLGAGKCTIGKSLADKALAALRKATGAAQ